MDEHVKDLVVAKFNCYTYTEAIEHANLYNYMRAIREIRNQVRKWMRYNNENSISIEDIFDTIWEITQDLPGME